MMKKSLTTTCLIGMCLSSFAAGAPDYLVELEKNAPTKTELEEPGKVDYPASDIRVLTAGERAALEKETGFDAKPFGKLVDDTVRLDESLKQEAARIDKDVLDFCKEQGIEISLAVHARPAIAVEDKPINSAEDMLIDCDKGIYFDSSQGLVVYIGNVKVRDPRLNLDCDRQLKVYLHEGPPQEKKGGEPKKEDESRDGTEKGQESKHLSPKTPADTLNVNFDGIKKMTAEGNVVMNSKDDKGEVYWARAQRATYNALTGEILMTGLPMMVQYMTHNSVTNDPNAYIRVTENGAVVFVGKWTTKLRNIRDQKSGFGSSDHKPNRK